MVKRIVAFLMALPVLAAIDFGNNSGLTCGSGLDNLSAITVYARITRDTNTVNDVIIGKGAIGSAGWVFDVNTDRQLHFVVNGTTDLYRQSLSNTIPADGAYREVAITWDGTMTSGTSITIYLNGSEVSYAGSQNGASRADDSSAVIGVGADSGGGDPSDGKRECIAVWDSVLSSGDLADLFAGGCRTALRISAFPVFFTELRAGQHGSSVSGTMPNVVDSGSACTVGSGTPVWAATSEEMK